ncbi:MAG: DNA repair protein RadA [Lachnospiraceae bacterium]|nr:DNA repair protein RadA [Lachnospiraceae bacterium]
MAKTKKVFFCQECGYESSKWLGQCPACQQWNTFVEETVSKKSTSVKQTLTHNKPVKLEEVAALSERRISTHIEELDRVLGSGIVSGSLILVGGDPGIGKSTLLLQICKNLSHDKMKLLYVSGEESVQQIKMRADRIGEFSDTMELLCETSIDAVEAAIIDSKPEVVVIDSVQTMYSEEVASAAGSVSQVREVTGKLMRIAKQNGITIFIVGHVTKEGVVAGPRTLEHMVDTVLYFEGDRHAVYRVLRGVKNRFGSTDEIGVFEMQPDGLREVANPSEVMLSGRPENAAGSVVVASVEGTRPILIEIQALVSETSFNIPRRTTVGLDFNRVNLLIAVLDKRAGLHLGSSDAYVNVAGGIKLNEPAIDLGIVLAMASSFKNKALANDTIVFGEVGLTGEIRGVSMALQRVKESVKLGFKTVIMPKTNYEQIKKSEEDFKKIKLIGVENVSELLSLI